MRYLIYVVIFFISIPLFSQPQTTLSNKKYKEYKELIQYNFSSSIDNAWAYSVKIGRSSNPEHQAFAKGTQAYIYSVKGDKAKSVAVYSQAQQLLQAVPASAAKESLTTSLLNYGGLIDLNNKDFSAGLDKFVRGKALSEAQGDKMQTIKFNNNIAIINAKVKNYASAIRASRQSEAIINSIQNLYSNDYFMVKKSSLYFNLGKYYEEYYYTNRNRTDFLDSALFYFNKAIVYTNNSAQKKIVSQIGIGNVYKAKEDFDNAERMYLSVLSSAKENNLTDDYFRTMCNLGDLYFYKQDYMKSLVCFEKVDSVYQASNLHAEEFLNSNYYQAKIYSALNNEDEALKHTRIYFDIYEKLQATLSTEAIDVNSRLSRETIKKELEAIREDFQMKSLLRKIGIGALVVVLIGLLALVIRNEKRKKAAEEKVRSLIAQYKSADTVPGVALVISDDERQTEKALKYSTTFISAEKEHEILEKLKAIEEKCYYLRPDFTQQAVARKIKTNTSYLSIVVNKYYNRSFGEYFNELRINWVIKEMISNPKYRKYSTQAIAESAGFKSAVSFTKSFNKRTGVTPVQFIKGLEKNSLPTD